MSDSHQPAPASEPDPRRALRALIERGEGTSAAATMLRLMWLRRDHPDANLATEVVEIEDNVVVIRATIALGTGAAGSGLSAEHITDERAWPEAVERTETNAIARALDTLGYVLEASATRETSVAQPQPRPQRPEPAPAPAAEPEPEAAMPEPAPIRPMRAQEPQPEPEAAEPAPVTTGTTWGDAAPPQVVGALRRMPRRPETAPAAPTTTATEDEDHLEDYSWTAFWSRARELGLNKTTIEERLGRPTHGLSPRQLREALEQTGLDFGD